jgi:hypothetical protein
MRTRGRSDSWCHRTSPTPRSRNVSDAGDPGGREWPRRPDHGGEPSELTSPTSLAAPLPQSLAALARLGRGPRRTEFQVASSTFRVRGQLGTRNWEPGTAAEGGRFFSALRRVFAGARGHLFSAGGSLDSSDPSYSSPSTLSPEEYQRHGRASTINHQPSAALAAGGRGSETPCSVASRCRPSQSTVRW